MSPSCDFVTFGGGPPWREGVQRLTAQARRLGLFRRVHSFDDLNVRAQVPALEPHWPFISSHPRGFGYWIWKPAIVTAIMDQADPPDVVCYLDSGCELLPGGAPELGRMIDFAASQGAMMLDYARYPIFGPLFWCKPELWEEPELSALTPADRPHVPMVSAGSFLLSVTPRNRELLATWLSLATRDGGHLVDDTPPRRPPGALFFEHRHDQAILSLLKHTAGLPTYGSAFDYSFTSWTELRVWPELLRRPFLHARNASRRSITAWPDLRRKGVKQLLQLDYQLLCRGLGLPPRGKAERFARKLTRQHRGALAQLGLRADCSVTPAATAAG